MLGCSKHSINVSYHDYYASPQGLHAGNVNAWKIASCSCESQELGAPILKGEMDSGSWFI